MGYHSIMGPAPSEAQIATMDPRNLEIAIFKRITAALKSCKENQTTTVSELTQTVQKNSDIWIFFAKEVAHPDHPYPEKLRRTLMDMAQLSVSHGMRVLSEDADLTPLIEMNTIMIQGLERVS